MVRCANLHSGEASTFVIVGSNAARLIKQAIGEGREDRIVLLRKTERLVLLGYDCRLVGAELTFIRSVTRFDSGACNLRVGLCPSELQKLGLPGKTPGPATAQASDVMFQAALF